MKFKQTELSLPQTLYIVISFDKRLEIGRSKMGPKLFLYLAELGLGHLITPIGRNQYSDAKMKQIVHFFISENVEEANS